MVNVEGGWHFVAALAERQLLAVEVAFWARLTLENKWVLYIATPDVNRDGLAAAYRRLRPVWDDAPEWGIDPFTVSLIGADHPMAKAAAEYVKPKVPAGPFGVPNAKPYRGITRVNCSSLGGIQVDGVIIYPPWEVGAHPFK